MWSDDRSRKLVGALDYAVHVVILTPGSQGGTSIGQRKGSLFLKLHTCTDGIFGGKGATI